MALRVAAMPCEVLFLRNTREGGGRWTLGLFRR